MDIFWVEDRSNLYESISLLPLNLTLKQFFLCPTNSGTLIRGPLKIVFHLALQWNSIEGAVSETPERSNTSTSASQTSEGFLSAAALSIAL